MLHADVAYVVHVLHAHTSSMGAADVLATPLFVTCDYIEGILGIFDIFDISIRLLEGGGGGVI
jgi:hypothetical protein